MNRNLAVAITKLFPAERLALLFFFLAAASVASFIFLDELYGIEGHQITHNSTSVFSGRTGVYGVFWDGPLSTGAKALDEVSLRVDNKPDKILGSASSDGFDRNFTDKYGQIGMFYLKQNAAIRLTDVSTQYSIIVRQPGKSYAGYCLEAAIGSIITSAVLTIVAKGDIRKAALK